MNFYIQAYKKGQEQKSRALAEAHRASETAIRPNKSVKLVSEMDSAKNALLPAALLKQKYP